MKPPSNRNAAPSPADRAFAEALALHRAGRDEDAGERCRQALAQRPGHFDARYLLGVTLARRGQDAQAIAELSVALTLKPESVAVQRALARLYRKARRFAEAVDMATRALAQAPDEADILIDRGLALRGVARNAEALADFDSAARRTPGGRFPPRSRASRPTPSAGAANSPAPAPLCTPPADRTSRGTARG